MDVNGNNKKGLQYEFVISLLDLTAEYTSSFNFKLKVQAKKGKGQLETSKTFKYETPGRKNIPINEEVNLIATLSQHVEEEKLEDKLYGIYLMVYTKNGFKPATFAEINLIDYLNKENQVIELDFVKCPFTFMKLQLSIKAEPKGEAALTADTQRSSNAYDTARESVREAKENTKDLNSDANTIIEEASKRSQVLKPVEANTCNTNDNLLLQETVKVLNYKFESVQKENVQLSREIENLKSNAKGQVNKDEVKEKEKIITELKNKNQYYVDEITELKAIIEEIKSEKKKTFEEKNQVIKEQRTEIESLTAKLSNMEKSLAKKEKEQSDAIILITKKDELIQEWQKKYKDFEERLKNEKENFLRKIKEIQEQKDSNDHLVSDKENEIISLNRKLQGLTDALTDKEDELTLANKRIEDLQNENKEISIIYEKKVEALTNRNEELEENVKSLLSDMEQLKDKNLRELESEFDQTKTELDEKESQLKQLIKDNDDLKNHIVELESKIQAADHEQANIIEKFKSSEKKYKDDIIKLRNILDEKHLEMEKLSDSHEKLKYENEKLKQDIKTFESDLSQNEKFFQEITNLKKSLSEKEKQINEEKENEIKSIKKELENVSLQLKKNNSQTENQAKMSSAENQFLKNEIRRLKEEVEHYKDLREKSMKLQKESFENESVVALLKKKCAEKEMEYEGLKNTNNEQKYRIELLENEVVDTKHKLAEVLNELGEMERKVSEYEKPIDTEAATKQEKEKKKGFRLFGRKKQI